MEIKKGTSRIALVCERYTVKVPNPATLLELSEIWQYFKDRNFKGLARWFQYSEGNYEGFRYAITGLLQNWREFILSKELSEIAVPTRLSIFGLLNLQDTATDMDSTITDGKLFSTIGISVVTNEVAGTTRTSRIREYMGDSHTFHNRDNFGLHGGKKKIRDYGGVKAGPILRKYHQAIKTALEKL